MVHHTRTTVIIVYSKDSNNSKQAGAELCQAQVKLGVIVYIGVKVEVKIEVEIRIHLLARVVGNGWVNGPKQKQAGAELCQAQVRLGVIAYIG